MDYVHPENGAIEQLADGTWKVFVWAKPKNMEGLEGVRQERRTEQTDALKDKEVFSKHFVNKQIFPYTEHAEAFSQILLAGKPNVIRLGMTGYSSLNQEQLRQFGITLGAYERICEDILGLCIRAIYTEYPDVIITLPEGASDMGVDKAIKNVADFFGLSHLGYSCPRFMMYVKDDNTSVIVCPDQPAYSKLFINHTQVLMGAAGRFQALNFDIAGATEQGKKIFFADVMPLLSTNQAIPPTRDEKGFIQDATGAFLSSVEFYGWEPQRPTHYKRFLAWLLPQVVDYCRKLVPADIAYGSWKRDVPSEFFTRRAKL